MGTISIESPRHVAVVAEDAKTRGKPAILQLFVDVLPPKRLPVPTTAAVHVVDAKKFQLRLTTA
jgi:hypothetical protein